MLLPMMVARAKTKQRKMIGGIVLIALILPALFAGMWHHFNKPKHPADLVEFWSERYSSPEGQLEQGLRSVIVPEIDFSGKPLVECLEFVLEKINQSGKTDRKIKYAFLIPDAKLDEEITLKLTNVPASEALRYVASLAQLKYSVEKDGVIQIVPVEFSAGETFEGKFFCPQFVYPTHHGKGPHSIMKELTSAGITFRPRDKADYYPEKEVLIVSTTENQMELVEVFFASVCYFREPSLYEKISYRIQEFFNPSPPLPPIPVKPIPVKPVPATGPITEPDPFGATNSTDPFGTR